MPFGMSWDEFRRQSTAAKSGDAAAAAAVKAGAGLHVHPAARVAIAVGGVALGARAAGLLPTRTLATRTDPVVTRPVNGGVGTQVLGVGGTLLNIGLDWLRQRAGGSTGEQGGGQLVSSLCPQGQVGK